MKIQVFGKDFEAQNWRIAISTFLNGIKERTSAAVAQPKIIFTRPQEEAAGRLTISFDFKKNSLNFDGSTRKEVGPAIATYNPDTGIVIASYDLAKIISALRELAETRKHELLIVIFLQKRRRVNFWKIGDDLDFSATTAR
jgi:hypothetical protein